MYNKNFLAMTSDSKIGIKSRDSGLSRSRFPTNLAFYPEIGIKFFNLMK